MSEKGKIKQSLLPVYLVYILWVDEQTSFTATFFEFSHFCFVPYYARTLLKVL